MYFSENNIGLPPSSGKWGHVHIDAEVMKEGKWIGYIGVFYGSGEGVVLVCANRNDIMMELG
jgi:hypothetical protein